MPAKDVYHDAVKHALIKDGWTITHDPFRITYGNHKVYADLGAQRILAAVKGDEQIVVEIKSFQSDSEIFDFEVAVGQYVFYRSLLERVAPERTLVMAVPIRVFTTFFDEPIARPALEDERIRVLAFDPEREVIVKWVM
ncbi:MAG: XisH family protein [Chloroflexi bacterium]|nr:XisH family protein [Chloroflexota bacterium]